MTWSEGLRGARQEGQRMTQKAQSAVLTQRFIDASFQVRELLQLLKPRNVSRFSKSFVQFLLEFGQSAGASSKIIDDGARGTFRGGIEPRCKGTRVGQSHFEVVSLPAISCVRASAVSSSFPRGWPLSSFPCCRRARRSTRSVGLFRRRFTAAIAS